MVLPVGDSAPLFSLPDQDGVVHSLSDYLGKWVLVYFYPKDDTPGCTTQACGLRDSFTEYTKAGLVVLGVSVDSVKKHKKFQQKYELPFTLLSDEQKDIVTAYGVWQQKKFMGREYMGIVRTSFLISPQGVVAHIFDAVDVKTHAQLVLSTYKELAR
jgi:peroxiredoxin Q/BCP